MAQVYKFIDGNGEIRLFAEIDPPPASTFNGGTITNPLTIDTATAGTTVLAIDAPTHDGSTSVIDAQDDLGATLFLVSDQGNTTVSGTLSASGNTTLGGNVNAVQLYLIAAPAQSSPIAQVFNASALAFQFDKDGRAVMSVHSAPADGDLAAGECALWFDQTDGAAKLMVKAKTANGTVRTGSLALT